MREHAEIWCDGSGLASGGPAGIAFAGYIDGEPVEGSLPVARGTNQQAEILAAAFALHSIPSCRSVALWSDSEYVVKGITVWIKGWIERGWMTRENKPVKNMAHWLRLQDAVTRHGEVAVRWCKGHDGILGNERADLLAGEARLIAKERAEVTA